MPKSPFPSCFRPSSAADNAASVTTTPNLTTCIYNTQVGLFALSWSRSGLFSHSLHLRHHHYHSDNTDAVAAFHLIIKPFPWSYGTRRGSKKLNLTGINKSNPARIYWDLSGAKYGSGPDPISGFYITIVVNGEIVLFIGYDEPKLAFSKSDPSNRIQYSPMVLRREHIYGTKPYTARAKIGEHERDITIDCRLGTNPRLSFSIDGKKALLIKNLKWKFRGNESIEIDDGVYIQVSWDVYDWLFDHNPRDKDGYALFMFSIFNRKTDLHDLIRNGNSSTVSFGFGFEEKKMMKKKGGASGLMMRSGRSSSFSSLSSVNSASSCSSSVMEWANGGEDDDFMSLSQSGFSLLVYAWK